MRPCVIGWALVLVGAWTGAAQAQTAPRLSVISESAMADPAYRQMVVHSDRVGRDFVVVVAMPNQMLPGGPTPPPTPREKLPVVYALDGGYGIAGPIARMLATSGAMEPAYVVTIDYPQGPPATRSTDFLHRPVTENGATYGGGGAKFQVFLTEELRPYLEARYPMDPSRAVLFGHSFGGLFAANVLADKSDAFFGYIIASASTWRDLDVTKRLGAAAGRANAQPVFVAVGGDEAQRMRDGAEEIARALGGSSLKVQRQIFPGENHLSFYVKLTETAFRWVLPGAAAGRVAVTVNPQVMDRLVGRYLYPDGRVVTISRREAKLFAEVTGMPGETELLAETETRYFVPGGFDVTMTFEGGGSAPPAALNVRMNGAESRAVRSP